MPSRYGPQFDGDKIRYFGTIEAECSPAVRAAGLCSPPPVADGYRRIVYRVQIAQNGLSATWETTDQLADEGDVYAAL